MRERRAFSLSLPRLAFLAWGDFHARSRFARSTIPEGKRWTTRSLSFLVTKQVSVLSRSVNGPNKVSPVNGPRNFVSNVRLCSVVVRIPQTRLFERAINT